MTFHAAMTYAELTEAYLERGDVIDGMHTAIENLNVTIKLLQEMAQHTNDAVEDAFGIKPSNEPDENHLALIEDAGYRLMRTEATIERVKVLHVIEGTDLANPWCASDKMLWPCPTIRALEATS